MSFFRNFPTVAYNFGNETFDTTFHNLTTYIDLIDQIADDASFYEKYYIQDFPKIPGVAFGFAP